MRTLQVCSATTCDKQYTKWTATDPTAILGADRAKEVNTPYGSSCSQAILVYLHPFRRNSVFCSQKSTKIT